MEELDFYERLQVSPKASLSVIKKAYRVLLLEEHPDQGGSEARTHQLNEAYRVLSDPKLRDAYDKGREKETAVLLVCRHCGTLNRVKESQFAQARCGRCGKGMHELPRKKQWITGLLLLLVGFLGFLAGRIPLPQPVPVAKSPTLTLVRQADRLLEQNQFAKAVPLYQRALALEPQAGTAYSLGMACQLAQQPDGAVQAFKQALALDSRHRRALVSLGELYRDSGKLEEALRLFKQASVVENEDPELHFRMAELERMMGDSKEAVKELHLCLEQGRSNPILVERARRALREMGAQ